jgi:alpha-1,3-mannosyltransferase
MQQVEIYLKGEKDYAFIEGGTGPLVYPGLHVYIYRWLYALTGGGENVFVGQVIFLGVYLLGLGLAMGCYRNAKVCLFIDVMCGG